MTQTTTTKWVTKTQLIAIRSDLQAQINGITYVQAKINERFDKNDECYGVKYSLKIHRYKFQICTYLYNNNNAADLIPSRWLYLASLLLPLLCAYLSSHAMRSCSDPLAYQHACSKCFKNRCQSKLCNKSVDFIRVSLPERAFFKFLLSL